ncbi:MAG TPA: hypothetical protein VMK65_05610, partial [Longimicrobiales bacterium]|nr:hypothetical protein [Longimicrobiales bacterium]
MCGIVGVTGVDHAAELAFLGLYALQHRGQEAAGIAAIHDGSARLRRVEGMVADSFDEQALAALPGSTALGHTRYSTAGGAGLMNAQPIGVTYHHGDLALVHNGNITNALSLRARLVNEGAIFNATIDSEVVVHLIARSRQHSVDDQVREALRQLTGAFSLLITVGDALYAARDPWGYRPLALGQKDDGWVLASETCALDIMGARFVRELAPGEILKIEDGELHQLPELEPAYRPQPCIFELVYFARPDSRMWGESVDRARRSFGRRLAE